MRLLSSEEKVIIELFANKLDQLERVQLLEDLSNSSAETVSSGGSRVIFEIENYQRPPYEGQHLYGAEGRALDDDGTELSVQIYADQNGRLLELEIVRWDFNDIINPKWDTLKVF